MSISRILKLHLKTFMQLLKLQNFGMIYFEIIVLIKAGSGRGH